MILQDELERSMTDCLFGVLEGITRFVIFGETLNVVDAQN
jgi:hypothetical protein